jgi:hypothetical protein
MNPGMLEEICRWRPIIGKGQEPHLLLAASDVVDNRCCANRGEARNFPRDGSIGDGGWIMPDTGDADRCITVEKLVIIQFRELC